MRDLGLKYPVTQVFFLWLLAFPALAAERPLFMENWATPDRAALTRFLISAYTPALKPEDLLVAASDLNGDSAPEFIAAPRNRKNCHPLAGCTYAIAAFDGQTVTNLGFLKGFSIVLSDKRSYGIREILVYSNPDNDYAHARYIWDPKRRNFQPADAAPGN